MFAGLRTEHSDRTAARPMGQNEPVRDRVHRLDRGPRAASPPASAPPTARARSAWRSTRSRPKRPRASRARVPAAGQAGGVLVAPARPRDRSTSRGSRAKPAGVICEIMNEDGTMARMPDLQSSRRHGIEILTIADLIAYRRGTRSSSSRGGRPRCRPDGEFHGVVYRSRSTTSTTSRWSRARAPAARTVLVRVHSECLTGDVFASMRCDCGEHRVALAQIEGGAGRSALPPPGRARHRPRTSCAPTGSRTRASTRSRPTCSSASRPTCATTASARRSSSTSACGEHADPHQQPEEDPRPRGYGLRDRAGSDRATDPTRTTRPTWRPSASGWPHDPLPPGVAARRGDGAEEHTGPRAGSMGPRDRRRILRRAGRAARRRGAAAS